jgi:phycoerythrocyanin-associated rod linker protein
MNSLVEKRFGLDAGVSNKVELRPNWTEDELQQVFRAAYQQVFGRETVYVGGIFAHAESQLRNGQINVRQFITTLAKSEFYKDRFFYNNSQMRFIELNYKHLLGRAPYDQAEISHHVDLYASSGYDADIDSYISSQEYDQAFGDNTVPYHRGFTSLAGMKTVGFNRIFALHKGNGNSDAAVVGSKKSVLGAKIAGNLANSIIPSAGSGSLKAASVSGDNRVYLVEVATGLSSAKVAVRLGRQTYKVPYSELSKRYQEIHKKGGRILSITPL